MRIEDWNDASDNERESFARGLVTSLPPGFTFEGVLPSTLGGRRGQVARFEFDGAVFVYVPGGRVTLGFDANQWTPSEAELDSFSDTAADYGIGETISEYVGQVTLSPRTVDVASLLVEQIPRTPRPDASHAEVTAAVAPFRLPASDEWEHLIGGGSTTLFRWGDHAPTDRYPIDEGFSLHRQPNAYGVSSDGNPYHSELLDTPEVVRGGDGGMMICGGAGYWIAWLTLATAFFDRETMTQFAGQPIDPDYVRVRRVLNV